MPVARKLLIVGAGGHGRQVAEAVLLQRDYQLVGFVDDGAPSHSRVWDHPVLGVTAELAALRQHAGHALVAIGNNVARERLTLQLRAHGVELVTLIHTQALVSPRARVGAGSSVMAGACVGTEAELGEGVIVNSGAVIDHHCAVGDFAHLGVGVLMAGGSRVGRGAWLRAGSVLGYRAEVAAEALLPPGSVLGE